MVQHVTPHQLPKTINYLLTFCQWLLKTSDGGFVPLVKKLACDWLKSGSYPVGMAAVEQTRPCCLHSGQLFIACLCLRFSVSAPPSPFTRARVNMPVQIAITQRQWQACTPSLSTPSSSKPPLSPLASGHAPYLNEKALKLWLHLN